MIASPSPRMDQNIADQRFESASFDVWIETKLRGPLADKLIKIAARRGQAPHEMVTDLIERAIEDDLFDAVIDDR